MALITVALAGLIGCASSAPSGMSGYPGFTSPRATLDTFFSAKMKGDYETTWRCYYKHYGDKVTKAEFIQHSKDDPTLLTAYEVRSIVESGTVGANARISLTFKTKDPKNPTRQVDVSEQLVNESGQWRIKVW